MENSQQDKLIRDAQYRKGLSIAFFNSLNSAISLVSPATQYLTPDEIKNRVKMYRDYFLEEHKNYYATVIANVGVNYNAEEAIKKLQAVKSKEELHIVWLNFSADERADTEISKVAQQEKQKYEKTPSGTENSKVATTPKK